MYVLSLLVTLNAGFTKSRKWRRGTRRKKKIWYSHL